MCRARTLRFDRRAFTLVEVLIVVTIIGILAATLIPLFPEMKQSAGETTLRHNLSQIRSAIERYSFLHKGNNPGQVSDGINDAGTVKSFTRQLESPTDVEGVVLGSSAGRLPCARTSPISTTILARLTARAVTSRAR